MLTLKLISCCLTTYSPSLVITQKKKKKKCGRKWKSGAISMCATGALRLQSPVPRTDRLTCSPIHCPVSPPSGKIPEVQEEQRAEGWRQGEKNRREENSNALPGNSREPATTSPHDISERKCDTPSSDTSEPAFHSTIRDLSPESGGKKKNRDHALCITPTDTIHRHIFPCIFFRKRVTEMNAIGAIATSPTPDLPSRKLFLPYRKKHDITDARFNVKLGGNRHKSSQQHRNMKLLQYGNLWALFM